MFNFRMGLCGLVLGVVVLVGTGAVLQSQSNLPAAALTSPISIPEERAKELDDRLNLAVNAQAALIVTSSLLVDKESPCHKQVLKLLETNQAAAMSGYNALWFQLRSELKVPPDYEIAPDRRSFIGKAGKR